MKSNDSKASTFGQRLKHLRERLGMSGAAFAKAVGFDRSYVFRIEQGTAANPSLSFIEAVVNKFGVDREWFVGGVGSDTLQVGIKPTRTGFDGHIQMRLDCLVDIIETLDDENLPLALHRINELADSDKQFGKILGETANIVAAIHLRRQSKQSPKKGNK